MSNKIEQFDNKWEELKAKQSNYLKELYSDWDGSYDGSEPAELAELMNTSYYKGYDYGSKAQCKETIEMIKKICGENGIMCSDDCGYKELIKLIKSLK